MTVQQYYRTLIPALLNSPARKWANILPDQIEQAFSHLSPRQQEWQAKINTLPTPPQDMTFSLETPVVTLGCPNPLSPAQQTRLQVTLKMLKPWRKGPYCLFDEYIDSEWRSDIKWNRLLPHITPLTDRLVLDVGCGNGYHGWRMLGAGASRVIGIDPTMLFIYQFLVLRHFLSDLPFDVLPLAGEHLPDNLQAFDTVFSMGVLYHRKSPIGHLLQLRDALRVGGELILETLIIEGDDGYALMPAERYAGMKNVWFLPTITTLITWMRRCGFGNIRCVDISWTDNNEQRATEWTDHRCTLETAIDRKTHRTHEGYPAPRRAIIIANRC